MVQQIAIALIGLYLLLESIVVATLMDGGDKICRLAKYLFTAIIGFILFNGQYQCDGLHIFMGITIALFLWPKTPERVRMFLADCKKYCQRKST